MARLRKEETIEAFVSSGVYQKYTKRDFKKRFVCIGW